jgi:hypothetical protein
LPAAVPVSIGCSVAFRTAPRPDSANDVLKVSDASGEAIDAGDHQNVAGVQEFQHGAECLAALCGGAAPFLGADDLTTGCLERRLLDREVLIRGAHPGVSDDGHRRAPLSRLALDRSFMLSWNKKVNPIETQKVSHWADSLGFYPDDTASLSLALFHDRTVRSGLKSWRRNISSI